MWCISSLKAWNDLSQNWHCSFLEGIFVWLSSCSGNDSVVNSEFAYPLFGVWTSSHGSSVFTWLEVKLFVSSTWFLSYCLQFSLLVCFEYFSKSEFDLQSIRTFLSRVDRVLGKNRKCPHQYYQTRSHFWSDPGNGKYNFDIVNFWISILEADDTRDKLSNNVCMQWSYSKLCITRITTIIIRLLLYMYMIKHNMIEFVVTGSK